MASIASQIQKLVGQHVPLIRFKYGVNRLQTLTHTDSSSAALKPAGTTSAKPDQKSTTLEFYQTPSKYRRKALSQEEIDLISIGGFS